MQKLITITSSLLLLYPTLKTSSHLKHVQKAKNVFGGFVLNTFQPDNVLYEVRAPELGTKS